MTTDASVHFNVCAPRKVIEGIESAIDKYLREQGANFVSNFEWE